MPAPDVSVQKTKQVEGTFPENRTWRDWPEVQWTSL